MSDLPPCVIFEDEHLLVVHKPPGVNTHAPAPFAGEGIYDWLRARETRWASLAILHRLDKETSGILLFSKTRQANQSLARQFNEHTVRKRYLLVTDRPVKSARLSAVSSLVRSGDKYLSRPLHAGAGRAETRFRIVTAAPGRTVLEAEPVTGKTHQIRVHAAAHDFPILGDVLYGGTPALRLHLHAQELEILHPAMGARKAFHLDADWETDPISSLRAAFIDARSTDAYRLVHGAADGWPGWFVDQLGGFVLSQSERPLNGLQQAKLAEWITPPQGAYHKTLQHDVGSVSGASASPQWVLGALAPAEIHVRENQVTFALRFSEGYSVGLFLDQRDNRRRVLTGHVAGRFALYPNGPGSAEVLNVFAYTCGFSVCAAKAGARTTSLDLSRKYLDWGQHNFRLNQLDPTRHDFIFGDAFDWLRRLAKKQRTFDLILLDPPTFSRSKEQGTFRAESDYGQLVSAALPLLKPEGVLFASSNAARLRPESFLETIRKAVRAAGRAVSQEQYFPQPPDFPVSREEPAYLKTVWMRVG